jgi:hydroxysqualene dehydroxylase
VSLFEAARTLGGRARRVETANASAKPLDNGQHILIGAYSACAQLMSAVGIKPEEYLLRMPMELKFPDGVKLSLPRWPAPLHVLAGIAYADGLTRDDKLAFIKASLAWRSMKWRCDESLTVAQLTQDLTPIVRQRFTDLLCISALNTAPEKASAQVFLNVLRDSLGAKREASDFLLPRVDLSALVPDAAANCLVKLGHKVMQGTRVNSLTTRGDQWLVNDEQFDAVIIATPALEAARLLTPLQAQLAEAKEAIERCNALQYEPITTVYVRMARKLGSVDARQIRLPKAMLALNETPTQPAQFIFDRGLLCGDEGLFSLIVSASSASQDFTDTQWLSAAREALAQWKISGMLTLAKVISEKRATFACTAALKRPAMKISESLLLAGDYVENPYPSTLEGAVRSGLAAADALRSS